MAASPEVERLEPGRIREARMIEMVFPGETNHYGTLFGGRALALMDKAAFVAASRYARRSVVTACSERIDFHVPVREGQLMLAGTQNRVILVARRGLG
ncbi:MAG TPA: acyl-CoA thioesterase [Steroidobacteraceae bacterium]|nr:acyl-CoA thioesterase [Steroidobacteraceae bacterium]